MANYLDLLLAVDDFTRHSSLGCIPSGYEMHGIAREAGLVEQGHGIAANWTGVLVELQYLTHGPSSLGDSKPLLPGRMWGDSELQRFLDYRVTASGREEADRMRRLAREQQTDASLGLGLPKLTQPWMNEDQRRAILAPLETLRASLDEGRHSAAIGAAKDLVEATCKLIIESSGQTFKRGQSLPVLFKQAREATGIQMAGEELGRSLAATVQRLAELRNAIGAGHGHASIPDLAEREAQLAATAASGVATFLLSGK